MFNSKFVDLWTQLSISITSLVLFLSSNRLLLKWYSKTVCRFYKRSFAVSHGYKIMTCKWSCPVLSARLTTAVCTSLLAASVIDSCRRRRSPYAHQLPREVEFWQIKRGTGPSSITWLGGPRHCLDRYPAVCVHLAASGASGPICWIDKNPIRNLLRQQQAFGTTLPRVKTSQRMRYDSSS